MQKETKQILNKCVFRLHPTNHFIHLRPHLRFFFRSTCIRKSTENHSEKIEYANNLDLPHKFRFSLQLEKENAFQQPPDFIFILINEILNFKVQGPLFQQHLVRFNLPKKYLKLYFP